MCVLCAVASLDGCLPASCRSCFMIQACTARGGPGGSLTAIWSCFSKLFPFCSLRSSQASFQSASLCISAAAYASRAKWQEEQKGKMENSLPILFFFLNLLFASRSPQIAAPCILIQAPRLYSVGETGRNVLTHASQNRKLRARFFKITLFFPVSCFYF